MKLIGLVLLSLSGLTLRSQTLPPIQGTAVSGRALHLPKDMEGKVSLLIVGFTRNSSTLAAAWASRFKEDFRPDGDPAVLRLAFLEEVPRIFRGLARSGVERSAGQDRDEVVPIFESEALYKQLVHYSRPDDAYVLVVDRMGAIRGVFTGDVGNQYPRARDCVDHVLQERALTP
jgi:hypothetical protein